MRAYSCGNIDGYGKILDAVLATSAGGMFQRLGGRFGWLALTQLFLRPRRNSAQREPKPARHTFGPELGLRIGQPRQTTRRRPGICTVVPHSRT